MSQPSEIHSAFETHERAACAVADIYARSAFPQPRFIYLRHSDGHVECEIEVCQRRLGTEKRWFAKYYWILSDEICIGAPFPPGAACAAVQAQVLDELGRFSPGAATIWLSSRKTRTQKLLP